MKNSSAKYWLILLIVIGCLFALIPTFFTPIFVALRSKATRLYPQNTTNFVKTNQIFVYQVPAESRGLPFGLHCSPLSPSLLENGQSPVLAMAGSHGQIIDILPDPVNNIHLLSNSQVTVLIKGECYLKLRPLGDIGLFEYPISKESFRVGESRFSQEELTQLIHDYTDEQFPPEFFEEIPFQ